MFRYKDEWDVPNEDRCFKCQETKDKEEDIRDWFGVVVDQIYSSADLDRQYFERCLEELCHLVGVDLPKSEMQIQRKEEERVPFLSMESPLAQEWKKIQADYLMSLRTGELV